MKKIGLIGGLGPESTMAYYKLLISTFHNYQGDFVYPEILIYSANLSEFITLMENRDWDRLTDRLVERIRALHLAGAEFAAIASNTPHVVFDRVKVRVPIPMLSIIEETCVLAGKKGFKKLGLLGTKFTMESDFFQKPFRAKGMEIHVPDETDQILIHQRLFSEIELGIFKDSTKNELLAIVQKMVNQQAIEALILGCTELPLILSGDEFGIPFLDTMAIHAQSIVDYCLKK